MVRPVLERLPLVFFFDDRDFPLPFFDCRVDFESKSPPITVPIGLGSLAPGRNVARVLVVFIGRLIARFFDPLVFFRPVTY